LSCHKKRDCIVNTSLSNSTLCRRHFNIEKIFNETGKGNAIVLVEDSSSLGLIFKTDGTDDDIQVPNKKRRTQNALSLAELKIELSEAELSVEGSKSVLRMRLESSKLDNFEMTKVNTF
jgi:hypothetical protein